MNNNQTIANPPVGATQKRDPLNRGEPSSATGVLRSHESLIQWPSASEIAEVSERLARMVEMGMRFEADGDYFKSGDLAYQIQQIITTTDELLKRCQRGNG